MFILEVIINSILLLASTASLLPQIRAIRKDRTTTGLSPWYLLFNLIIATQILALMLLRVAVHPEPDLSTTRDLRHWLDLFQFVFLYLGQFTIFILFLSLPPKRPGLKTLTTLLLLVFSFFTLGLVLADAIETFTNGFDPMAAGLVQGLIMFILNPLVQLFGFIGLFLQFREVLFSNQTLKPKILFAQAVAFGLVGISFMWRFQIPDDFWEGRGVLWGINFWYWMCGWAVFDTLIFAGTQGVLGWMIWRREKKRIMLGEDGLEGEGLSLGDEVPEETL